MFSDKPDIIDIQDLYKEVRRSLRKLPPPDSLLQMLDLNALQNEHMFELFIYKFAYCIWPENEWEFFLFGKRGVLQYGIDILGLHRKGIKNPIVLQVKKYSKFRKEGVVESLEKFLEHDWSASVIINEKSYMLKQPQSYYLCMACKIDDTEFQEACGDFFQKFNDKGTELDLYDQVKISNKLKEDIGESGKKLIYDFFGEVYFKAFYGKEPPFSIKLTRKDLECALAPITKETLRQAQKNAQERLAGLKIRQGEEYEMLCNEEALIGLLPEWHHLYMGGYGAFTRLKKEEQVLLKMNENVHKLTHKRNGLLLHVISGDPGCGKSTLVKLVFRRLIENQNLQKFPHLSEALTRLRIFDILKVKNWQILEHAVSGFIEPNEEKPLYLVYFDDLFVLENEEVNKILGIFNGVSDRVPIYFLATSPSWTFDPRDLYEKKKSFQLVDSINTKIEGLESEDRKSLKLQYQEMYGEHCREDLLKLIESREESLVLIKLALHHNLTYSQYFDRLFQKLEAKESRYLAALILFSILSRFYVHFPVTLIQEFNEELQAKDRLWEKGEDYEEINHLGLRLFKIRYGNRSLTNPSGLPDTVAPFHDRVAQVIHDTWGEKRKVPVFNCALWELRNKVYSKFNESIQTRPILANVFRGQLRVASNQELSLFIRRFGPVHQNRWMLLNEPDTAYRWITYSKSRTGRTKDFQKEWSQILNKMIQYEPKDPKIYLAFFLLNPHKIIYFKDQEWISVLSELEEKYFSMLNGVLNELLNQRPLPTELLSDYLSQMEGWLDKYPSREQWLPSYRYLVLISLIRIKKISKPWLQKQFNYALAQIVKGYLVNISNEYATNGVLGIWGLKTLVKKIEWVEQDSARISESLIKYIQVEENKFRPVLFELLLIFIRVGNSRTPSGSELFSLFYRICIQNSGFYGLTYTSQDFWEHLKALNSIYPTEYRQLLINIVKSLSSGKLDDFMKNTAYPDFLDGLMRHLIFMHYRIGASELLNLVRPLVANFNDPYPAKYIFRNIEKLFCPDVRSISDCLENDIDRQIRLCLAKKINLSLELTLKDFTELLEEGKIIIPTALSVSLVDYLKTKKKEEFSTPPLEEYRKRIYAWLRHNIEKNEAILFFPLICVDILFFPEEAEGFETLAALTIQNDIPDQYFPFSYFSWWLKEEVDLIHSEQKYILLDAFWNYSLRHSNFEKDGKFVMYEKYLLYLLDRYEIRRDEIWWGRAVKRLMICYNEVVVRSRQSKFRKTRFKRRISDEVVKLYKQRACLDQMMETILRNYSLVKSKLKGDFRKIAEETLTDHKDKPWTAKWQLRFDPEAKVDGTKSFLDYLNSIEDQPVNIFNIRNQANWWLEWIKSSKPDLVTELKKVWQWLDKIQPSNISIFLLPLLFEFFPSDLNRFKCGSLVKNVIKKVNAELKDKSYLIKIYVEYLETFNSVNQNEFLKEEIDKLREILSWFLNKIKGKTDTQSAAYGLQILFAAALKYKLDFELFKAEEVFFRTLEAQIEHVEGGELSKHYFPWLLRQKEQVNIAKYLEWIKNNYQKRQTPYVFKHLIGSLSKNTDNFQARPDELDMIWDIFKLLISKRLDSEGTTGVTPDFFEYFTQIQQELSDGKNRLNKIPEEFWKLCLQMSNHGRVIYLLINFRPFWQQLSNKPSPQEMIVLWRKIWSIIGYKMIEPFGKLTTQINNYLQERKERVLISEFHGELINFIERNLGYVLSSKFTKILLQAKFRLRELSALLPKLVRCQKNMEELRYTIEEYFQYHSEILGKRELIEFETSMIEALRASFHKPFSEICVSLVIKKCTPNIHYERITQLVEMYLKQGRESRDFWQVLQAYHTYEEKSDIEKKRRKATMESFLSIIRSNAQSMQAARYFSAILQNWEVNLIPQESAIDTLRHLILQTFPSRWRRIKRICEHFHSLFGPEILLFSTISIGTVLNQLERDKEVALISIKQQLQRKENLSTEGTKNG